MSTPATMRGPRRGWWGVTLTVAATLAIVLSIAVAVQQSHGSRRAPDRDDTGRVDLGQQYVPGPDMRDTANLEKLVDQLQTVYGTTEAISATLYPEHAVVLIPKPDAPGKQQRLTYNGIFHREIEDERRTGREALIDLRTVDWDAVTDLTVRATRALGVPDVDILHARVTLHADQHQVTVTGGGDSVETLIDPVG